MDVVEGRGATEDDAVADAATKLGLTIAEVSVQSVKQGKKFLGLLGESGYIVQVAKKSGGDASPPVQEGETATHAKSDSDVKNTLETILGLMRIEGQVVVSEAEDGVKAEIISDKGGLLIGRRGETLDSLEYLLNRMVNKDLEERIFVAVDTEDYRNKRKVKLLDMASSAIAEVRETGRPYRFQNLNAKERKIIHMAVQVEDGIDSISKGEGFERKLIIKKS